MRLPQKSPTRGRQRGYRFKTPQVQNNPRTLLRQRCLFQHAGCLEGRNLILTLTPTALFAFTIVVDAVILHRTVQNQKDPTLEPHPSL
ncbi:hypothetical protein FKM82_021757 [Ascaphus truei]